MYNLLKKIFKNPFSDLGISSKKIKSLKKIKKYCIHKEKMFGKTITVTHPFWFSHSIEEIFLEEIYKFKSDKEDPLIIDCGANWGLSIIYFKKLYPKSKIIAFEADENIFKILKDNIEEFELDKIQLLNMAVWKDEGYIEFSSEGSLGGTVTSLGVSNNNINRVKSFRLRNFLENEKVDFLKIDIEGAEYEVLRDCKDVLNNATYLFVEYHSLVKQKQSLDEILYFIKEAGFRYYVKEANKNMIHPFIDKFPDAFDLQLNIFCYRPDSKKNR